MSKHLIEVHSVKYPAVIGAAEDGILVRRADLFPNDDNRREREYYLIRPDVTQIHGPYTEGKLLDRWKIRVPASLRTAKSPA